MPMIADQALDAALSYIDTNATILHINSSEPTSYALAGSTSLGNKTPPVINAPTDRAPNGREIIVQAVTDGSVTADGTASHWSLVSGSVLLAAGALSSSQAVSNGNTFTLTQFAIGIPDAV